MPEGTKYTRTMNPGGEVERMQIVIFGLPSGKKILCVPVLEKNEDSLLSIRSQNQHFTGEAQVINK